MTPRPGTDRRARHPSSSDTNADPTPCPDKDPPFTPPCLSLDLEVGIQDSRIHAFGAIRPDTGQRLVFSGGNLTTALAQLDELAQGANFLLGHNLITFDLPHLAALAPEWDWATCAVIAREWRYLDPVRAFCEVHRIPVQMGSEEIPRFWRLRETRTLVAWLRGRESRLVDTVALRAWLEACSPGPWITLLQEAVDDYALETGGAAMPVSHCIEWLAEWGREVRRRQRGLLLLTAHSAKGLEFDHVAVLDGGWGRSSRDEDPDAARRLYYVAMTRARQTLVLTRFISPPQDAVEPLHPLPHAFPDSRSVLRRPAAGSVTRTPAFARQYCRPGLHEINLGFAGRYPIRHPVHRAIAALSPGDPLTVRVEKSGRWALLNRTGTVVGHLAKGFAPPGGTRCSSARVLAVVDWSRDASEPGYQDHLQCDDWEVVVPELVFEPDGRTSRHSGRVRVPTDAGRPDAGDPAATMKKRR